MNNLPLLLAEFHRTPWALMPATLAAMQFIIQRWADGVKLSSEEIQAAIGEKNAAQAARHGDDRSAPSGDIAVIPVYGVIGHRARLVYQSSSGINTSTELLSAQIARASHDNNVKAIVLDIDSPGGSVAGVAELADQIYAARKEKKVIAVANNLAASAAYWIGAAASEVVIIPSGEAGSVGVYGAHENIAEMLKKEGREIELISAGKYKVEGSSLGPLTEEARAFMKSRVDDYYEMFVKGLAKYRGVSQAAVRDGFGQGRCLGAEACVKEGMADRIGTLDQVLSELMTKHKGATPSLAHAKRMLEINGA